MTDVAVAEKKMLSRKSPEVVAYIQMVEKAKRDAEVVRYVSGMTRFQIINKKLLII
jgi:hypothetical protein